MQRTLGRTAQTHPAPASPRSQDTRARGTPEWVLKFNFDVEGTLRLVGTLHAQPKLSVVAAARSKGEDGKDLG